MSNLGQVWSKSRLFATPGIATTETSHLQISTHTRRARERGELPTGRLCLANPNSDSLASIANSTKSRGITHIVIFAADGSILHRILRYLCYSVEGGEYLSGWTIYGESAAHAVRRGKVGCRAQGSWENSEGPRSFKLPRSYNENRRTLAISATTPSAFRSNSPANIALPLPG